MAVAPLEFMKDLQGCDHLLRFYEVVTLKILFQNLNEGVGVLCIAQGTEFP